MTPLETGDDPVMFPAAPWVALFGMLGIYLRWSIQLAVVRALDWPVFWATMAINALGSLVIGFLAVLPHHSSFLSEPVRVGLTVGLLGGFTTFSAYSIDSWSLFSQGQWGRGLAVFIGSPLLGLAGAALGVALARTL